jgi:hypothetical protein
VRREDRKGGGEAFNEQLFHARSFEDLWAMVEIQSEEEIDRK